MDLEARSLQPNVKVVLLAKLREYKSDLNNVKTEVKRLSSGGNYLSARDDLLESGMADTLTVSLNLYIFIEARFFFLWLVYSLLAQLSDPCPE